MNAASSAETSNIEWFGHPRGLSILFLTQMWESFSYYGMRALLVFYMTRSLMFSPGKASLVFGVYSGAVYFTPILGGIIADRWLGRHRSVILGGAIMAAGHFMMASPALFFPALAVIAIGNGLFLPSLPSQIDSLYQPDDPRRVSAYNIYYAGLNLGAVLAPLVCGGLGESLGWHWGFGAAGVGMLGGVVIYIVGHADFADAATTPNPKSRAAPLKQKGRIGVLVGVIGAVVLFRGAYEQAGNTVALWIGSGVDRAFVGGVHIPMTWFQSLNPLFVFALTPLIVARRARQGSAPAANAASTMMTGALITACAFALLAVITWNASRSGETVHWLWVVLFFGVYTWGELHILPTGLALFSRIAPTGHRATSIAFWYSASFFGNLFAGVLGTMWGWLGPSTYFAMMMGLALTSGAALGLLIRPVIRLET